MRKYSRLSEAQVTALALTMMAVGGGSYGIMASANSADAQTPIIQNQDIDEKDAYGNDIETNDDTDQEVNDDNETEVYGSIKLGAEPAGEELDDAVEAAQYAGLATITADEAKQIAEARVGGAASDVQLGDENGTLIYEVLIGGQEVKVDAGNGAVLAVEADDGDHHDDLHEAGEAEESDGDGEENDD